MENSWINAGLSHGLEFEYQVEGPGTIKLEGFKTY